jgi:hypothetical protein
VERTFGLGLDSVRVHCIIRLHPYDPLSLSEMVDLGTALALVAFADQCIKSVSNGHRKSNPQTDIDLVHRYGNKLLKRCKSYHHAVDEAKSFLVIIECNWSKTEAQIKFLKSIVATLDEDYVEMQSLLLSELEGQLKTATLTLD